MHDTNTHPATATYRQDGRGQHSLKHHMNRRPDILESLILEVTTGGQISE